jgi:cytochrome c peroxidase
VRHHLRPAAALRAYDGGRLPASLRPTLQNFPVTVAAILTGLDGRMGRPQSLSGEEVVQLLAFLEALTDPAAREMANLIPARVPSGLPVAGQP